MFIINAPFVFTAVYAIVKNFVDEKTRKKIQVVSSSYAESTLAEVVDADQLADFLPGGKNTANLMDDVGPWCDFEVVDGVNPTDVVGVRKKGTEEIITHQTENDFDDQILNNDDKLNN